MMSCQEPEDRLLDTLAVRLNGLAICSIQPDHRLEFGIHDDAVLHYVVQGSGTFRISQREFPFGPDTAIMVPPGHSLDAGATEKLSSLIQAINVCRTLDNGIVNCVSGDGEQSVLIICARISTRFADGTTLLQQVDAPIIHALDVSAAFRNAFTRALEESTRSSWGSRALAETLMKECVILLMRQHWTLEGRELRIGRTLHDPRLARVVASISESPSAEHSVASLAAEAGMSRSAFSEHFATVVGQAPMEYVQSIRMQFAAELLHSTKMPIKTVAQTVGYASRSHFSRAFRLAFQIPPSDYRAGRRR